MSAPTTQYGTSVAVATVHQNTEVELIVVTLDRLRIVIANHKSCFESRSEWQVPAGVLATLVTTFLTTSFRDAFGFKADYWQALYSFVTLTAIIWLGSSLWKLRKSATMEQLIESIKKGG